MTVITAHTSVVWSAEGIANDLLVTALFRAKCLMWETAVATVHRSSNNPISHLASTRNSTKFSGHGDLATEICVSLQTIWGTRWRSPLTHCATSWKVAGSIITDGVTGIFHWHTFRLHCGPGVDSVFKWSEYQEYFRGGGVRAAGASGRQPYRLHVPIVLTSVSLNLLESLGSAQACTATALPLPLPANNIAWCTIRSLSDDPHTTSSSLTQ